jgi:predicted HTH domain antitoxin
MELQVHRAYPRLLAARRALMPTPSRWGTNTMIWQLRQLEKLSQVEPELVATALEELLRRQQALRDKLVIGAYLDGEISLAKAAELFEQHPVQLRKMFLEKGIPVRLGAESKEELIAEAAAARTMREGSAAK